MSLTDLPQHTENNHSKQISQAVQPNDAIHSINRDSVLSTKQPQDTFQHGEQLSSMETHAQSKKALIQRRSLDVDLDPALCQRLKEGSTETANRQQQQNDMDMTSAISNKFDDNGTAVKIKGTRSQVNKLKSSLRQVVSAPTSPQQKPSSGKSVKFDPLHLEKVYVFQGSHSPREVPRSDGIKCLPFKVVYSHWPPIQHILFQQDQNVQLKRSLKILDGGTTLHGQVLVRNLGHSKQVEIRYTLDGWQTVKNVMAEYRHSRGFSDLFAYDIPLEQGMMDRGYLRVTVDLAVRYTVTNDMEKTFWDNNNGHNYQIQVVDTSGAKSVDNGVSATSFSVQQPDGDISHDLDTVSSLSKSSISPGSHYDFGESLIKAKQKMKPEPSPSSTTSTDNNDVSELANQTSPSQTQSAPSSPREEFPYASGNHSLTSSSYSELVKKYCFYGSQDASSSSPALSING